MNTRLESSKLTLAAAAVAAVALTTVACGSSAGVSGQASTGNGTTALPLPGQIAVNCGPGQQTMIRPSVVNGQAVSQVECVAVPPAYAQVPSANGAVQPVYGQPVYGQPAYAPAATVPVGYAPAGYAPVAQAPVYPEAARPVSYRPAVQRVDDGYVEYRPARPVRRVKTGRSWQKSAIIIGSSAGIGAGIGAASGGKKGALIGAAIGGGASAIWDQVTRNKR